MHKVLYVFIFCCFGLQSLQAQDFHAGLRFGMSATQVSGDNLSGFDKAGVLGGAFVNRDFSQKISVQMEMIFIQKGSRKPVSTIDNSYYRMRLHYIEVPLLLQFHPTKKICIEGGLSAGVLIFSREDNQLGDIAYTPPFNKMEIASHFGVQFVFSEHWALDLRHSGSLNPVRNFQGSYNYNYFDRGQYNSTLQLSMEYTF
ncbi:MAG TPA: porin family protein [Bacteroidia bacterium]|nr:porin family protein [Bacteroidia bacterium]